MKNKILVSIYLFVLMIGLVVGCTPTEGEPVAVDRPTTLPTMTSEPWTIDLLINNSWRVVEAQVDGEKIDYITHHLTRFGFSQSGNEQTIGVRIPCLLSRDGGSIGMGSLITLDQETQIYSASKEIMTTEQYCTGISEISGKLFALVSQENVQLTREGEQIIFTGQKGRLILAIDNDPIPYATPLPTAYP